MKPIPIAQYLNQQGRMGPSALRAAPIEEQVVPKPRASRTPEELEQEIDRAFEQARQQGLAAARSEMEAALAKDKAERDERELAERLSFRANEYAKLASKISEGMREIELRTAETVARILKPYLTELQRKRTDDALLECLRAILSAAPQEIVKVAGPAEKLEKFAEKLAPFAAAIEFTASDEVDFSVVAQHTLFETQMKAFATALESLTD